MASTFTFRSQPWTSSLSANSSERPALYVVFVHTPVILPSASSRPCIAATPLLSANGLGFLLRLTRSGLSPPNYYPRRAHRKGSFCSGALFSSVFLLGVMSEFHAERSPSLCGGPEKGGVTEHLLQRDLCSYSVESLFAFHTEYDSVTLCQG